MNTLVNVRSPTHDVRAYEIATGDDGTTIYEVVELPFDEEPVGVPQILDGRGWECKVTTPTEECIRSSSSSNSSR